MKMISQKYTTIFSPVQEFLCSNSGSICVFNSLSVKTSRWLRNRFSTWSTQLPLPPIVGGKAGPWEGSR